MSQKASTLSIFATLCKSSSHAGHQQPCLSMRLPQRVESMEEKRYRKLLLGMDLTQDFFFSYT